MITHKNDLSRANNLAHRHKGDGIGSQNTNTIVTHSPPLQAHLFGKPFMREEWVNQTATNRPERDTFYHWHYFEFFCPIQRTAGVAILSLQDPFSCGINPQEKEIPASIYLTFRNADTHKLTHYAYVLLYGWPATLMRRSFHRFLAFAEPFEWRLSRLGGQTGYRVRIERLTDWRQTVSSSEAVPQNAVSGSKVLHHWHLLHTGPKAPARVTIEEETPYVLPRPDKRVGALWDIPTAVRMAHAARSVGFDHTTLHEETAGGKAEIPSAQTHTSPVRALRAPCIYWDSNYGHEPLHQFKTPWIWRRTGHGPETKVHYIFPTEHCAWRMESERLAFVQRARDHLDLAPAAHSPVAFRSWVGRQSGLFSMLDALGTKNRSRHESAPFYLRFDLPAVPSGSSRAARCVADTGLPKELSPLSGTEEWMNPKGINSWPTRLLFPLRQTVENNQTFEKRGYQLSALLTKRNGQSFYVASHVLSLNVRRNAYAIYAVCRIIDDATDECHDPQTGSGFSSALIKGLTDQTHDARTEDLSTPLKRILCQALQISPQHVSKADAAQFLVYARTVMLTLQISKANLQDLVDGQRDDEHFTQPKNFIEFYSYCYKVAGVVGLMMARVFGAPPTLETDQAAEHLGIAMQITNILRDIREDFELKGRIYLPIESCDQHRLNLPEAIRKQSECLALQRVVTTFANKAIGYYQSALSGVGNIPGWRQRLCVRAMAAIYGSILAVLISNPQRALEGRVVIPRWKKILIFLMVLMGRDPLAAAGFSRQQRQTRKHLPHLTPNGLVSRTCSTASRPG